MRKLLITVLCAIFTTLWVAGSSLAVPVNLIKNGDFEFGGGSLAYWQTSGDATLYFDGSNNSALLGNNVTGGTSYISQDFKIRSSYTDQTISFDYDFLFTDTSSYGNRIDVFAVLYKSVATGLTVDTEISLGSYEPGGSWSGGYSALLDPQLIAGIYRLKFNLNENSNSNYTDSSVLIDNVKFEIVPEPATILLLGAGLLSFVVLGRRKMSKM